MRHFTDSERTVMEHLVRSVLGGYVMTEEGFQRATDKALRHLDRSAWRLVSKQDFPLTGKRGSVPGDAQ